MKTPTLQNPHCLIQRRPLAMKYHTNGSSTNTKASHKTLDNSENNCNEPIKNIAPPLIPSHWPIAPFLHFPISVWRSQQNRKPRQWMSVTTIPKSLETAIFTAATMVFPPMMQLVQCPDIYKILPILHPLDQLYSYKYVDPTCKTGMQVLTKTEYLRSATTARS